MVLNTCNNSLENSCTSEYSNWCIMALTIGSKIFYYNPFFSSGLNSLNPDAVISLNFYIVYLLSSILYSWFRPS